MRALIIAGFLLWIAACAVRDESPDGITIEHDAYQPELAVIDAQEHCEKFGKKAVLVSTSPPEPTASMFYLNSSKSVFDCVPE